ncbi:MAG: hypothetical protein ACO1N7_02765, partial [Sphingobacteriaceae bacterium]
LKELFLDGNNMTKTDWLVVLSKKLNKKEAKDLSNLALENNSVSDLLALSFFHQPETAFRAAWILEHTLLSSPVVSNSFVQDFLANYPKQKNKSCRRHFTRILMLLSEKKNISLLNESSLEPVIEATFEWLIDPKAPIAVQANCLSALFNLKDRYDWVEAELKAQIVFLLKDGSAGLQVRGRKVLELIGER